MGLVQWWPDWLPQWAGPGAWLRKFAVATLKRGHTPRHVAFIMDGNRRFAKRENVKTIAAHAMGFETLKSVLEWCMDLNVEVVTVYAFSIENFKRPKEEVDNLMELAKEKFTELLDHSDLLHKHDISVRMLGDLTLLPKDVQAVLARVVIETAENKSHVLNVCMSYTAQDEMTRALRDVAQGVEAGVLQPSDCSEELIEKCLYTGLDVPVDLCVRTSGEVRLSDFLVWQNSYAILVFLAVMWPELQWWHLMYSMMQYTMQYPRLENIRKGRDNQIEAQQDAIDRRAAVQLLIKSREEPWARSWMESHVLPEDAPSDVCSEIVAVGQSALDMSIPPEVNLYLLEKAQLQVRRDREERCKSFVESVHKQRLDAIRLMSISD